MVVGEHDRVKGRQLVQGQGRGCHADRARPLHRGAPLGEHGVRQDVEAAHLHLPPVPHHTGMCMCGTTVGMRTVTMGGKHWVGIGVGVAGRYQ